MNEIRTKLAELDGSAAKKELDENGVLKLPLADGVIELTAEDLLIETAQAEGLFSMQDNGITVALDTTLTPELVEEGFVREIISKIQTMRKEADFNVMDHIVVYQNGSEKIAKIIQKNPESIQEDVLAVAFKTGELAGYVKEWGILTAKR